MTKRDKKRKLLIVFAALAAFILAAFLIIDASLKPLVLSIAEARLEAISFKALNDAILQNIDEELLYDDLVSIVMDNEGHPAMLQANTVRMNRIAAQTALTAQNYITEIGNQGIEIALGTVLGGPLFTGQGPPINVQIVPAGSVESQFISEFSSAGINQTRHRINLRLTTSVRIVYSGGGQIVELNAETPIAESIIVGNVPGTFLTSPEDQQMNLVPDMLLP